MVNVHDMYNDDADFKAYVDRCADTRHLDIYTVLQTKIVMNYAEYLLEQREGKSNETTNSSIPCQ